MSKTQSIHIKEVGGDKVEIVTPKAKLLFPNLVSVNPHPKYGGKYDLTLSLTKEDAKALRDAIVDYGEKAKSNHNNEDALYKPIKMKDEVIKDEKTGNKLLKLSSKKPVYVVDAKMNPLTREQMKQLTTGATVKCKLLCAPTEVNDIFYFAPKVQAIQVIAMSGGTVNTDTSGFEEEEGFSVDDLVEEADSVVDHDDDEDDF